MTSQECKPHSGSRWYAYRVSDDLDSVYLGPCQGQDADAAMRHAENLYGRVSWIEKGRFDLIKEAL